MPRICFTTPAHDFGRIEDEDGNLSYGPIPPEASDVQAVYDRLIAAGVEPEPYELPAPAVPDSPTLADWRVGLLLWGRLDDVSSRVSTLMASKVPAQATLGRIAQQQLEYSNNVSRARLTQIRDAFGFSAAEVDESLWRADRVAQGDLSGVWPIPAT